MATNLKSLHLTVTLVIGFTLIANPVISQSSTRPTAPATSEVHELPLSLADTIFDYYRPKIRLRTLTAAEKAEIPRLIEQFLGIPDKDKWVRSIDEYYLDTGRIGDIARGPHTALLRLMELGESGDKAAMIAVREALVLGWGKGPILENLTRNGDTAIKMGGEMADGVRLALIGHWTAQIWHRYGPERGHGAAAGMKACLNTHWNFYNANWRGDYRPGGVGVGAKTTVADCGFSFLYPATFRRAGDRQKGWEIDGYRNNYFRTEGQVIANWVRKGGQPDFQITEFRPTIGNPEFESMRYRHLLSRLGFLEPNLAGEAGIKLTNGEWAWVNEYRARTGETFHWRNAMFSVGNIASFRREQDAKEAREIAEAKLRRPDFETDAERQSRRRFEWDQALRSGTMFSGSLPSAGVTVRNYDRNGNYLGSTVTTRGEAVLSGAKPQ